MSGETNENAVFKFGYPEPHPIIFKDTNKIQTACIFRQKNGQQGHIPPFPDIRHATPTKKRRADRPRLPSPAHISDCGSSAISQQLYKQLHRHGLHTVRQRPKYGVHCRFLLLQAVRQHCRQPHSTVLRQKQPLRRHRHEH